MPSAEISAPASPFTCNHSTTAVAHERVLKQDPSLAHSADIPASAFTCTRSTTTAAAAYERVLELDPSNADALTGLASIKFNSTNVQQVWCTRFGVTSLFSKTANTHLKNAVLL